MLKQISSASFIEATIVVTAVYYLTVALLFYRNEIKQFLTSKLLKRPAPVPKGKPKTPV